MSTLTPVLSLIKPALEDIYSVSIINANMDRIDSGSVLNANSVNRVKLDAAALAQPWATDIETTVSIGSYVVPVTVRYKRVGSVVFGRITTSSTSTVNVSNTFSPMWVPIDPNFKPKFWLEGDSWYNIETVGSCIVTASNGRIITGNVYATPPGAVSGTTKGGFAFRMNWSYYNDKDYQWPSAPSAVAAVGSPMPNMPDAKITASFKYRVV